MIIRIEHADTQLILLYYLNCFGLNVNGLFDQSSDKIVHAWAGLTCLGLADPGSPWLLIKTVV